MSDPHTGIPAAPELDEAPVGEHAPPIPTERYLVPAVRALEALKAQAEGLLLLLQHDGGNVGQINAAVNTLVSHCNTATNSIYLFQELRSCIGRPQ